MVCSTINWQEALKANDSRVPWPLEVLPAEKRSSLVDSREVKKTLVVTLAHLSSAATVKYCYEPAADQRDVPMPCLF